MWLASLRDLQWRQRRFLIGVIGVSLIFALTLIMSGISASLTGEVNRSLRAVGADYWVVPSGVSGPLSIAILPADTADDLRKTAGVTRAEPLIFVHESVEGASQDHINVLGYRSGGLGEPEVAEGRTPRNPGEAIVDRSLGVGLGEKFSMRDKQFVVVGRTRNLTLLGGQPDVFIEIGDVQKTLFSGVTLATTILVEGRPASVPAGFRALSTAQVRADIMGSLRPVINAMRLVMFLLWGVAAAIIGAIVYLSALERARDFAVFKAVGASTRSLGIGLAMQALLVSVVSAGVATLLAQALLPLFPIPLIVPGSAMVVLPIVAVVVGLAASTAGLRRVAVADPVEAFAFG